jgi:hypothetical protein
MSLSLLSIIRYFLLICKKDKIFISITALILTCFFVSIFFGWTMIDEMKQAQISYFAGSVRFATICTIIVFTSFFTTKLFSTKEIEFLCSTPKSRSLIVFCIFVSFFVICFFAAIVIGSIMLYFLFFSEPGFFYLDGYFCWISDLFLEMLVVSFFAIFISFGFSNNPALSIIISVCFYLVARSIGFITSALYLSTTNQADVSLIFVPVDKNIAIITKFVSKFVSFAFPRLDLVSNSSWILYSNIDYKVFTFAILQMVFYCILIYAFCTKDFNKKQF